MQLRELKQGQLALVLTGEFEGELFYSNVMGIHSITNDRYWPSPYAWEKAGGKVGYGYTGPLDVEIKLVTPVELSAITTLLSGGKL